MTNAQRVDPASSLSPAPRPTRLIGWLPDGTPRFAPVAVLLTADDRVCCHLCGKWFLCVASHLRVHGWNKDDYLAAFGLELSNSLSGPATHKRRAAALTARSVIELAVQQAQRAARERARSGELAATAAVAARGRAHPPERRPKTLAALAAVDPSTQAAGTARRGKAQVLAVAAAVAARFGFADFDAYAADRLAAGWSLAAISREAGLHKDWVQRHRALVAPAAAITAPTAHLDLAWTSALEQVGFTDVAEYLRTRHVDQHRTVAAIADEVGISRSSVGSALSRYGIRRVAHVGKRHQAAERDLGAARRVGRRSLACYLSDRRAIGATWRQLAAETGVPASTLRRRTEPTRAPTDVVRTGGNHRASYRKVLGRTVQPGRSAGERRASIRSPWSRRGRQRAGQRHEPPSLHLSRARGAPADDAA